MPSPERLATVGLLEGLTPLQFSALSKEVRWRQFTAETVVVDRHSDCRDLYLVIEGSVVVVNFSPQGREIAYAHIRAPDFFGELSAIDGEPRSASVVAETDCLLAEVPREVFTRLLADHPDVAMRVLRKLARVIRTADERIMDLATLGAQSRVCVELLRLAKPDPVKPGHWLIYPMPTQADIAALASTTRETVARVLGQLIESGLLRKVHKTVYLRSRDEIAELAHRLDPRAVVPS